MPDYHHERLKLANADLLRQRCGLIDGKWVKSNETFEVLDPATGLVWAHAAEFGAPETTQAIEAAAAAFPAYSKTPARTRARQLLELDRLIREAKGDLAQLLCLETGKPLKEAEAEVHASM